MQMKQFSQLLWVFPFISFIAGYVLLSLTCTVNKLATPNLVGKNLVEAVRITSSHNLNLRIVSEQLDQDLPENTILSQKPSQQNIKPNQSIFVVISKKLTAQVAPNLGGRSETEITAILAKQGLKTKSYMLPSSNVPKGICMGQSPTANQTLYTHELLTYISAGSNQWVVMPQLLNAEIESVKSFLETNGIKFNIKYLNDDSQPQQLVIAQKPAAGTIVNLAKMTPVDLHVTAKKM